MARTAIHPGKHLAEAIETSGITAAQLARAIEVPRRRVSAILHGTRGVTPNEARRLDRYFAISAEFWINLREMYDLRRAGDLRWVVADRTRRGGRAVTAGRRRATSGGKSPRCPPV